MATISDFATKFDCTVWPKPSTDFYGEKVFGAGTFLDGKIWYKKTNETFRNNNGDELTANYKILTSAENAALFEVGGFLALDVDLSASNPDYNISFEIMSVGLVKGPFDGLESEMIIMV